MATSSRVELWVILVIAGMGLVFLAGVGLIVVCLIRGMRRSPAPSGKVASATEIAEPPESMTEAAGFDATSGDTPENLEVTGAAPSTTALHFRPALDNPAIDPTDHKIPPLRCDLTSVRRRLDHVLQAQAAAGGVPRQAALHLAAPADLAAAALCLPATPPASPSASRQMSRCGSQEAAPLVEAARPWSWAPAAEGHAEYQAALTCCVLADCARLGGRPLAYSCALANVRRCRHSATSAVDAALFEAVNLKSLLGDPAAIRATAGRPLRLLSLGDGRLAQRRDILSARASARASAQATPQPTPLMSVMVSPRTGPTQTPLAIAAPPPRHHPLLTPHAAPLAIGPRATPTLSRAGRDATDRSFLALGPAALRAGHNSSFPAAGPAAPSARHWDVSRMQSAYGPELHAGLHDTMHAAAGGDSPETAELPIPRIYPPKPLITTEEAVRVMHFGYVDHSTGRMEQTPAVVEAMDLVLLRTDAFGKSAMRGPPAKRRRGDIVGGAPPPGAFPCPSAGVTVAHRHEAIALIPAPARDYADGAVLSELNLVKRRVVFFVDVIRVWTRMSLGDAYSSFSSDSESGRSSSGWSEGERRVGRRSGAEQGALRFWYSGESHLELRITRLQEPEPPGVALAQDYVAAAVGPPQRRLLVRLDPDVMLRCSYSAGQAGVDSWFEPMTPFKLPLGRWCVKAETHRRAGMAAGESPPRSLLESHMAYQRRQAGLPSFGIRAEGAARSSASRVYTVQHVID